MKASMDDIKELRGMTGAGIMDCKRALDENNSNVDEAVKALRKKGAVVAAKKSGRSASEGVIGEYIHFNSRIGVLVELNCETDFVARNETFTKFAHELAVHVAANNPRWITTEEVPESVLKEEREIYREQMKNENKPDNIIDKIIEGKLNKFYERNCLLKQAYSGDDSIDVGQAIQDAIQAMGENIKIPRFVRFELGEETE